MYSIKIPITTTASKSFKGLIFGVVFVVLTIVAPTALYAATASESTIITANIASVISVSSTPLLEINVTPTGDGSASSASDSVTVSTNNSVGYSLTLGMAYNPEEPYNPTTLTYYDTNTIDLDPDYTIDNHTGTFDSPTPLENNSWGYRVDDVGSFGSGPTSAETNEEDLSGTWARVKAHDDTPDTIKTTSSTATNDTTTVWYGVKADSSIMNGIYIVLVTYTATTN